MRPPSTCRSSFLALLVLVMTAQDGLRAGGIVQRRGPDRAEMVLVPAGSFRMGSADGDPDERPLHTVQLDRFWIDRLEVTNLQYRKFVEETGRVAPPFWGDPRFAPNDHPVVGVTWDDAAAYCRWAGKRLPTEAEWERAARGTTGQPYPWGTDPPGKGRHGNFADSSLGAKVAGSPVIPGYDDGWAFTAPVGAFPAGVSPGGCLDMAGNVFEWCADYYDGDYYRRSPSSNPKGPDWGSSVVVRGGSWRNASFNLRCSNRGRLDPTTRSDRVGFRPAMDAR